MLERDIENYLVKRCKEENILIFKMVSPSNAGIPDRLLLCDGNYIFIELKKPGEKPRKLQIYMIEKLKSYGATVYVADSKEKIDKIINLILERKNNYE